MQFRTTIVLLVLAVVAGAVWLVSRNVPPAQPEAEAGRDAPPKPTYVLDARPEAAAIVEVSVESAGKPELRFARGTRPGSTDQLDDWKIAAPSAGDAEGYMVDELAKTFRELQSADRLSAKDITPADAGLAPPTAVVTLRTKDDKTFKIEVGRKARMGSSTYVRAAGSDTICVVSKDLLQDLQREPGEYRAKSLLRFTPNDAVRASFRSAAQNVELSRAAGGDWVIDSPVKAPGNNDKVRTLVADLLRLRALEFVDEAPASLASFGLDEPYLTVSLTTETRQPAAPAAGSTQPASQPAPLVKTTTLLIGAASDMKSEKRFAKLADQPWVATVNAADVERLQPRLGELRDPSVTRIKEGNVTRLELKTPNASAGLTRTAGAWQGEGDLSEIDASAVRELLAAFEELKAVDYVDSPEALEKYGLAEPRSTITVTASGTVQPVTLRVGALTASGRNAYVQVDGQPSVLVVSERQAEKLAINPLALRARTIFALAPDSISRIELERGERRFLLSRRGNEWQFEIPSGCAIDPAGLRELTSNLSDMRARRVVGKNADAAYGLSRPVVSVRFQTGGAASQPVSAPASAASQPASAPNAVTHVLVVGRVGNVAYARRDAEPYVYELDETVYLVLTQELVNRQLLDLKPDEIAGVRIDSTGGTLEFVRAGKEWKYPADSSIKPVTKKVQDFVAELARLRVEQHLTPAGADLVAEKLDPAPATLTLTLTSGGKVTIRLTQMQPGELPRKGGWVEERRTFVLRQADLEKIMRGLDFYLQPEAPAENPGGFAPPPPAGFPPEQP